MNKLKKLNFTAKFGIAFFFSFFVFVGLGVRTANADDLCVNGGTNGAVCAETDASGIAEDVYLGNITDPTSIRCNAPVPPQPAPYYLWLYSNPQISGWNNTNISGRSYTLDISSLPYGSYYFGCELGSSLNGASSYHRITVSFILIRSAPATINVNETPNTGGTYAINGSSASASNTVYPGASGKSYTIQSTSLPSGCTSVNLISNSQGSGSSMTLFPSGNETFTIEYVCPPQAIDVSLIANGTSNSITVPSGQSVTLGWSTTGSPTSCVASNGWSGSKSVSGGSEIVGPTSDTTYTITCSKSGVPNAVSTVTVNVFSAPTLSGATGGSCGGQTSLSWSAVSGATSYKVYRNGTLITTTSSTTYTDTGLTPSTSYSYKVKANNGTIDSSDSNTVNVMSSSACVGPTVTLSASPTGVTSGSASTLSWTVSGATSCSASATPANSNWTGSKSTSGGSSSTGALSQSTDFSISCTNANGTNSATVTVTVSAPSPAPTVTLSASPTSGTQNSINPTITWSVINSPTSCSASNDFGNAIWAGSKSTAGGSQQVGTISTTGTKTFTLTCSNANGSDTKSTTVSVSSSGGSGSVNLQGKLASTGSFGEGPISIASGSRVDLQWIFTGDSTNYYCTGPATAYGETSGSRYGVGPISSNTTYTVRCEDINNSSIVTQDTFIANISAPPTVTLSANPTSVNTGSASTLTWTVSNATSCTASASPANSNWTGSKSSTGSSQSTGALSTTGTNSFTLTCTGAGGTTPASANVTVSNAPATISVTSNLSTSWSISGANPTNGTGTSGSHSASPGAGGASYTIVPASVSGYTVSVTSSLGTGATMTLFPGSNESFTITYTPVSTFDYSMANNGNVVVTKSSSPVSGQSTITETLLNGTTQQVTITASGAPSGVSLAYANNPCSPTCNATITFTVAPSTVAGTYPITVSGSGAGVNRNTSFSLIVNDPVNTTVSVGVNPTSADIGQPVTWTATVLSGTPPCTYSWSGTDFSGNPTTNPYVFTYQSTGSKSATVTVDCSGSITNATGNVLIKVNPIFKEF